MVSPGWEGYVLQKKILLQPGDVSGISLPGTVCFTSNLEGICFQKGVFVAALHARKEVLETWCRRLGSTYPTQLMKGLSVIVF